MADPMIFSILRSKKTEIESVISRYEGALKAAQTDLMHVNMTLRLFDTEGAPTQFPVHVSMVRQFKKNELPKLCMEALAASPVPLDTRELALEVARVKGLDGMDKILRHALAQRIHNALRPNERRGKIVKVGKRRGVMMWHLP